MSKSILVVEDQEDNRRILRDLLSSKGYEIIEVTDGLAGVEAAKREKPDLILMDIQLPGIDGYEATRRIKAEPDLAGITIIALIDLLRTRTGLFFGLVIKEFYQSRTVMLSNNIN